MNQRFVKALFCIGVWVGMVAPASGQDVIEGFRNLFRGGRSNNSSGANQVQIVNQSGGLSMTPKPVEVSESAEVLKRLFANQRGEAAEHAAAALRAMVPSFLEIDSSKRGDYDRGSELVHCVRVYGLDAAVLEVLAPRAEATAADRLAYAAVAEMFEREDVAPLAYQSVLELDPGNDQAKARLAMFSLAQGDVAAMEAAVEGLFYECLALPSSVDGQ